MNVGSAAWMAAVTRPGIYHGLWRTPSSSGAPASTAPLRVDGSDACYRALGRSYGRTCMLRRSLDATVEHNPLPVALPLLYEHDGRHSGVLMLLYA